MRKQTLINEYVEAEKIHIGILGSANDMFGYGLHFSYVLKKLQNNKRKVLIIDKYEVMRLMFYDNTLAIYSYADIDIVNRFDKVDSNDYEVVIELIDIHKVCGNIEELERCTSLIYIVNQDYKTIEALNDFTSSYYDELPNTYFVEYNVVDCRYMPEKLIKKLALDTESKIIEKHTIPLDEGNLLNAIEMQFTSKVTFKHLSKDYLISIEEIVCSILATETIKAKEIRKCFK